MGFTADDVMAARRHLARQSLADFACMVDIPTAPITDVEDEDRFSVIRLNSLVKHHRLICDELQAVADGETPNLMMFFPPGSAKSTYVDVVFTPWFMARYPRRNVILASYASEIARKQGRRARQLIKSKSFRNLMQAGLRTDAAAADQWTIDNGSEYMAGGLLSGLTGNRAALGIIDDPVAGREEAESETIRRKTWDAYIDDFCSRLIPGAPQIMIMTRWHQDDIAGRILPEDWRGESGMINGRDGRKWKVVCAPALADRADDPLDRKLGETLWPEWFSKEHWEPFKKIERTWYSLYQQKPRPPSGAIIKSTWWREWPKDTPLPPPVHIFASIDTAFSQADHKSAAYSARTTWMVFEDSQTGKHALLLLSAWWERVGYPDLRAAIKQHYREAELDCALIERKASGISLLQDLRKIRKPRMNLRGFDPGRLDKTARAYVASPMFEAGLVYYPNREWARKVIDLVSSFPAGAPPSADLTDTVTQAVIYTKRRMWATPPDEEAIYETPVKKSDEWAEDHEDDGKRESAYG